MDDQQQTTTKPISDDQELAEALAGVSKETNKLTLEEAQEATVAPAPIAEPKVEVKEVPEVEEAQPTPPTPTLTPTLATNSNDLDSIKKDALSELRPLIDRLDLNPEDKFDIYLLMLRSTDDKTLIAPAHDTAQSIADETRRAQALLDIIKEIDYLSNPTGQSA